MWTCCQLVFHIAKWPAVKTVYAMAFLHGPPTAASQPLQLSNSAAQHLKALLSFHVCTYSLSPGDLRINKEAGARDPANRQLQIFVHAYGAQHSTPWQALGLLVPAKALRIAGGAPAAAAAVMERPVLCHFLETTAFLQRVTCLTSF